MYVLTGSQAKTTEKGGNCVVEDQWQEPVQTSADRRNTLDAIAKYYLYKGAPALLISRVSIFPEKNVQPGTWNNPEKHLGTRNSGFKPGTRNYPEIFPSSNPELGKISSSNPEPGKISWFQPGTRKIAGFQP